MNVSQSLSTIFVTLYKIINKTGALDTDCLQSLFITSYFVYKKYLEDANAKLIKNHPEFFCGGHILDIGANIGYTAYVFANVLTPPYKVFAFEPEQRNIHILRKAAKKYDFSDKIVIHEAAVGDHEGEIELWQNEGHHADHRILTNELKHQLQGLITTQKTPLITIDSFLKKEAPQQPIAFIKIDVQGYELAVCQGMQDTLEANPQCIVAFEYCPSIMKTLGFSVNDLLQFFKTKNYYFYRLNKNGTLAPLHLEQEKNHDGSYFDIICAQRKLI